MMERIQKYPTGVRECYQNLHTLKDQAACFIEENMCQSQSEEDKIVQIKYTTLLPVKS